MERTEVNNKKGNGTLNREEIMKLMDDHLEPIELEDLVAQGLLEKRRGWYKVFDLKKLPRHVEVKVKALETNGQGETLVQFRSPSRRLEKIRRELGSQSR